jgi:hypothetical protein
MMKIAISTIVAVIALAANNIAEEPKELCIARQEFLTLKHPSEADRVSYITRLVRLRETFSKTHNPFEDYEAVDKEIILHPMPDTSDKPSLTKRLVGRWQSPRRPYFYHADGTWASDDDATDSTGGTWRIEGNRFFQNYKAMKPDSGETIILLTATDFVYGRAPYYLRKGTAFPWH